MEKIKFDSIKYYATIVVITVLIMGLFGYAYKFNSEKGFEDNISEEIIQPLKPKAETITVVTDIDKSSDIIDEDELYTKKDEAVKISSTEKEVSNQIKPFEIISEEGNISQQKDSAIDTLLNTAEAQINKQNYADAIITYEKILSTINDKNEKSQYLEKIAILNAKLNKYDSALSAAQKAYNLNPTTEIELLIARLYYKIGDTNRAKARIISILKRDF